jgi:hypothetical protein
MIIAQRRETLPDFIVVYVSFEIPIHEQPIFGSMCFFAWQQAQGYSIFKAESLLVDIAILRFGDFALS